MIRHLLLIVSPTVIVFSLLLHDSHADNTCTITNYGVNSMFTDSSTCTQMVEILTPPLNVLTIMKNPKVNHIVKINGHYEDLFRTEYTTPQRASISDYSIELAYEGGMSPSNIVECGGSAATGSGFMALNGEMLDLDALAAATDTLLSSFSAYHISPPAYELDHFVATINVEMKEDDDGSLYPSIYLYLVKTNLTASHHPEIYSSHSISCDRKGMTITENIHQSDRTFLGICSLGQLSCSSTCSKLSASDQSELFSDNLLSRDDNERSPAAQTAYEEASLLAKVQGIRQHLELYTYSEDFLSTFDECVENDDLNLAALSKLLGQLSETVESWQWAVDDIIEYLESLSDPSPTSPDYSTVLARATDRPTSADITQVSNLLKHRLERDTTSGTIYNNISYTSQDLFAELVQDNLWALQSMEIRALKASLCQVSNQDTANALISRCLNLYECQEDLYDDVSESAKFSLDKAEVICAAHSSWEEISSRRRLLSDDSTISYNGASTYNISSEALRYSDIDFFRSLREDCAAAVPDNTWVTDSEIESATNQCIVLYNEDSPFTSFTATVNLRKLAALREAEYNAKLKSSQRRTWIIISIVLAVVCTLGIIALFVILHNIKELKRAHSLQVSIIQAGKQKGDEF